MEAEGGRLSAAYPGVIRDIGPGELPVYRVSDEGLAHGASLGNCNCWVTTKATGDIESIFSLTAGQDVFGACLVRYSGTRLRTIGPERGPARGVGRMEQMTASQGSYAELERAFPGEFELHPVYQRHLFTLPGSVDIEQTTFLPQVGLEDGVPTVIVGVRVHNRSDGVRSLRVRSFADLCGRGLQDSALSFDDRLQAVLIRNAAHPDWTRLVAFNRPVTAYQSLTDRTQAYEPYQVSRLQNDTSASGDVMAALQLELELSPGSRESFCWVICFSHRGDAAAKEALEQVMDWERVLDQTIERASRTLAVSRVMVPENAIGDGALWSKVNMLRVMGSYPTGAGFTNDPGRSSNVVVRDISWFVYGCDYLLPEYSRLLLRNAARFQEESGQMVEYWDALTGISNSYGLNVNDDTPLFILAAGHHWLTTHDDSFLEEIYPSVEKAVNYLLSQKDERGLIFCTATGTGEQGICGWRNVIPGYRISGAVTEVNAESYAALRMAAEMARGLGNLDDVARFLDEAVGLENAINTHLLDQTTGLYYLSVDVNGRPNTDVTCDELFPVMFGVSQPEVSFSIISRLSRPDFWTDAGLRTASSYSPEYTPDRELGLRGGVWPGISFWYAFAAARYHPDSMERALSSFRHYYEDPLRYNTVPGQFSEWFDGESLANRGMRVSPWEPPRLLWAALEGMLGVVHSAEECIVQPLIPPRWKWVAVRDLPHGGHLETLFLARQKGKLHLYGVFSRLSSGYPTEEYDRDLSAMVRCLHLDAHMVALGKGDDLLVCVGSAANQSVTAPLLLANVLREDLWYYLEYYDSELEDWVKGVMQPSQEFELVAVPIEAQGFRLLRLTAVRM